MTHLNSFNFFLSPSPTSCLAISDLKRCTELTGPDKKLNQWTRQSSWYGNSHGPMGETGSQTILMVSAVIKAWMRNNHRCQALSKCLLCRVLLCCILCAIPLVPCNSPRGSNNNLGSLLAATWLVKDGIGATVQASPQSLRFDCCAGRHFIHVQLHDSVTGHLKFKLKNLAFYPWILVDHEMRIVVISMPSCVGFSMADWRAERLSNWGLKAAHLLTRHLWWWLSPETPVEAISQNSHIWPLHLADEISSQYMSWFQEPESQRESDRRLSIIYLPLCVSIHSPIYLLTYLDIYLLFKTSHTGWKSNSVRISSPTSMADSIPQWEACQIVRNDNLSQFNIWPS